MSSNDRTSGLSESARATLSRLTEEAKEKLNEDGSTNTGFNSAAFSLALSWNNAGGTEDDYIEAVEKSTLGLSYFRSDLHRRLSKTFGQAQDKAEGYEGPDTGSVREQLTDLAERLREADLPVGLRTTAVALVELGIRVNTWTVDASTRRLAELTGFSPWTVGKHLGQFYELGLVSRVKRNGKGRARTFHINMDYAPPSRVALYEVSNNLTHTILQVHMCEVSVQLLWTKHGLGPVAEEVYAAVSAVPCTVAEVSRRSGRNRQTVNRHLESLVQADLVIRLEGRRDRYSVNLVPDYARALEEAGAVQSQAERSQRYAEERARYKQENQELVQEYLSNNRYDVDPYSEDHRRYRLSPEGLAEIQETGFAWWHRLIPEKYREYEPRVDPFQTDERPGTKQRGYNHPFTGELVETDPGPKPDPFQAIQADPEIQLEHSPVVQIGMEASLEAGAARE